jgi:hypothetical protein
MRWRVCHDSGNEMASLTVIIGAGASYDCATPGVLTDVDYAPPLVTGLFRGGRKVLEILHRYRRAEAAAADIRRLAARGSLVIEDHLRDHLLRSPHLWERQQYREIPFYLQDLLFTASSGAFAIQADNYDSLLNQVMRLDEVTFISLNYDTLLDDCLRARGRIDRMEDYIRLDRSWALVKLHGSVDWGRQVTTQFQYTANTLRSQPDLYLDAVADLGDTLADHLTPNFFLRRVEPGLGNHDRPTQLASIRVDGDARLYYPALSAPLGADDELSCPPDHQEFLRSTLQRQDSVNLLIIGYSGLDQEVISFLRASGRSPGKVLIVNPDEQRGRELARELWNEMHGGSDGPPTDALFGVGSEHAFRDLVDSPTLAEFVDALA